MNVRLQLLRIGFVALIAAVWWEGHRVDAPAHPSDGVAPFRLREVSHEAGLDFHHVPFEPDARLAHIAPQIAGTGAGVSIVDADGDGRLDLFATSSGDGSPCALYLNRGDGTFTDVAAAAGLADLNEAGRSACMGSVWADMENDGDQDCFVYAFGTCRLFRNDGNRDGVPRFTDVTDAGIGRWMNAHAATWLDYDRDGRLDLYVCGYFRDGTDIWHLTDTRIMQDSFEFAVDGGTNRMFHNLGDGRFEEVAPKLGLDSKRWAYAVASADFDDDGWPDLYVANDYGAEELYLNRGGEHFERRLGAGLEEDSKSGMCVALGDVGNECRTAIFVTNISKRGFLFQGNNLRLDYLSDAGTMAEVAKGQVADCGWAWGASFGDLDLDGWQDLFVSNGFVSADPEREYWYDMMKISGGNGDVFTDAALWPPMKGASLSGFERSRVLHNLGDARFVDVAEQVGVDDRLDGRAVAMGDLFDDGTLAVVVANQKGPLLLYRNTKVPGRHWIEFELQGTTSNRDALGARLDVHFGDNVQRHFVTAARGFCAQNGKRIHVGLGDATKVSRVDIRWPSGREETLTDLDVDSIQHLVEPQP
ncbi:MAG: CRTAC1 family protein [Planctomycetes bacterium]|nr:CRTAC1 family protein [Planctomycetota bacterium]